LILLLLACARGEPPACPAPRLEGFAPAVEQVTRLDASNAVWEGTGLGACDGCVEVTGPGSASASFVVNRGVAHRFVGTVTSTAGARLFVRQETGGGPTVDVAGAILDAGQTPVDLDFTFTQPGESGEIVLEVDEGVATLDTWALSYEAWEEVEAEPAAPVMVAFLIHVERDGSFTESPDRWTYRAEVIERLADVFAPHGAVLTAQPDESFVRAAGKLAPGWLGDLTVRNVAYSVHVHAEDEGSAQDVGDAVSTARASYASAGLHVTDMNGGFGTGPWALVAREGIVSVSAFKDPDTQAGLDLAYTTPWRPPDGSGEADPTLFATHDPDGPVLYLPSAPTREVEHARMGEHVRRQMSQVLAHARAGFVNTWSFVLHVDNFVPDDEEDRDAYFTDGRFEADLDAYDALLTDVLDPLVAAGAVEYASNDEIAARVLEWEAACSE
jgi:hypothetical protein